MVTTVACLATCVVSADYVTLEHSDLLYASDGSAKHSSLVAIWNTENWSNSQMVSDQFDYYIGRNQSGENVYACTPNVANDTATWTFPGRSLTLDGGAGNMVVKHLSYNQSTMDFGAAPVYLKSGVYAVDKDGDGSIIKMNAVVQSPASAPFVFSHNTALAQSWAVNRNMTLNLTGDAGTAVRLTRPESATSLMQWVVKSDSSGYRGTLEVERMNLVARNSDQFLFGGCIRILPTGVFRPLAAFGEGAIGGIDLAGGTLELAGGTVVPTNFTASGGTIDFTSFHCANPSGTAYGCIQVTESATISNRTKVIIGGGDTLSLNMTCDRGEWPLIVFPSGTDVSGEDFELSLYINVDGMSPDVIAPFWSLEVKDDSNGRPTLYAVRARIVLNRDTSYAEHSIADAGKWSSGALPTTGAAYLAFGSMGKMYVPSDYTTFGGDLLYCYANQLRLICSSFFAKRLTFLATSGTPYVIWCQASPSIRIHGGVFECLKELGEEPVTFVRYNASSTLALEIASDIVGPGALSFNYRNSTTEETLRTITLTGTNDNFTGTMWFNGDVAVNVANGTTFGGAMEEVTYDAVRFTACKNGANPYKLTPTAPVVFDEPTRGWLIGGKVDFSPTTNCPLTVWSPITILGGQQKTGNGVLALGGPLKFTESFSDEPGTATDYYLAIRDGWIKPLAADAFNGLRLYFDTDSDGIELDWSATGDLKTYGLRNTKMIKFGHFEIVGTHTISVRFDVGNLTECPGGEHTFGLVTVPTEEADSLLERLNVVKPFNKVMMSVSKRENGDGTTTLVAKFKRGGFVIAIK